MKKYLLLSLVTDFVCLIITVLVTKTCWNWFVPVVFLGAPSLTFSTTLGLLLISRCFVPNYTLYKLEDCEDDKILSILNLFFNQLIKGLITPGIIIIYAWVTHLLLF